MLTKLLTGEIAVGKPTDFAVYNCDGKLLLQQGHLIDSEGLLQRLYRMGFRDDSTGEATSRTPSHKESVPADVKQLLFSAVKLDSSQTESSTTSRKSPSLPNFRQQVEFFHLMSEGAPDAIRMELAGVVPDEALIARHTKQDAPALATGMVYEARLFCGSRVFKFATRLLPESYGPLGCQFLEYPEVISQAIVRRHHRVLTSFIGKLQTNEYQRPPTNVMVENMSSIGFGISVEEDFLTVGQSARLTMNLPTENRMRPVVVVVEVRNRRQEGDHFKYGLEIVNAAEEVKRDIKDYVLETVAAS